VPYNSVPHQWGAVSTSRILWGPRGSSWLPWYAVGCSGVQWGAVGYSGVQWGAVGCSGVQKGAVGCSDFLTMGCSQRIMVKWEHRISKRASRVRCRHARNNTLGELQAQLVVRQPGKDIEGAQAGARGAGASQYQYSHLSFPETLPHLSSSGELFSGMLWRSGSA